jgi:hypothetical protein
LSENLRDVGFRATNRDADAGVNANCPAFDLHRFGDRGTQLPGILFRLWKGIDIPEEDCEFITSQASRHAANADGNAQAIGNGGENFVAECMSIGVIGDLEIIQVDEKYSGRTTASDRFHFVHEQTAVG